MDDNLNKPNQPGSPNQTVVNQTTPPAPEPVTPPVEPIVKEEVAKPQNLGKILLVEDDPPMVKMYSTKLKTEGFEVASAFDGEDGIKKIDEFSPDLVVLDLMIPKIGGIEVLEKMRTSPKTKNLPVVILSNLSQEDDVMRAKELGAKEYLIKANFTPGQVVEKIRKALGK